MNLACAVRKTSKEKINATKNQKDTTFRNVTTRKPQPILTACRCGNAASYILKKNTENMFHDLSTFITSKGEDSENLWGQVGGWRATWRVSTSCSVIIF